MIIIKTILEISENKFNDIICSDNFILLDVRNSDIFNGWDLNKNGIAGHVPNSFCFSADWINENIENDILLKELENLNIDQLTQIVLLYDNNRQKDLVANFLVESDFSNIFSYDLKKYTRPLQKSKNYNYLLPVEEVYDLINDSIILHTDWNNKYNPYSEGHVPNAYHVDSNWVEEGPKWIRKSDDDLIRFANHFGLEQGSKIIVYGAADFRIFNILKYLGFDNIYIMNGGLNAWKNKYSLSTDDYLPIANKIDTFNINSSWFVSMSQFKKMLFDNNYELVDIRGIDQWMGRSSGYDYLTVSGRIPGTKWIGTKASLYYPDGKVRPYNQIVSFFIESNIKLDKEIVVFCGTAGWGASGYAFIDFIEGRRNITSFEGGWGEWQFDSNNPIIVGDKYIDKRN